MPQMCAREYYADISIIGYLYLAEVQFLGPAMGRVYISISEQPGEDNYTSASMICITLDGIFVTRRGFCTLCLILFWQYFDYFSDKKNNSCIIMHYIYVL